MTGSLRIRYRLLLTCLVLSGIQAQDAVEQVETSRQSADAVAHNPRDSSAGQARRKLATEPGSEFGDLIVIRESAAFDPWRVRFNIQGFYTDNAALAPVRVEDYFLHGRAEVSYLNRISGSWNLEASVSQDYLRYDRFDSLDFDITGAHLGVNSKLHWLGDATFSLSYDLLHLTEPGRGDRITTANALTAALFQSWKLERGQKLQIGLMSQPEFYTEPDFAQRHDHSAFASWSLPLTDKLTARLTGRASYRERPHADRQDWNFATRLALTWQATRVFSLTASSGYTWNLSSKDRFDYRNQLSGVFFTADYRF